MKVILDLTRLQDDLATLIKESPEVNWAFQRLLVLSNAELSPVDIAQKFISCHTEEIAHGWTAERVAQQAVVMLCDSSMDGDLVDYCEQNVVSLGDELKVCDEFKVEEILLFLGKQDPEEVWIASLTVETAILKIHAKKDLFKLIKGLIADDHISDTDRSSRSTEMGDR